MSVRDRRRSLGFVLALLGLLMVVVVGPSAGAGPPDTSMKVKLAQKTYAPDDNFTAVWSRAQALKVRRDATNTKPLIPPDFPVMNDTVWVWDTWPLVNLGTKPISFKGWNVIFSLVAPRTLGFNDRHEVATIGYFYSRDAKSWQYGGTVFPRGTARGTRQWAGSATLIGDEVFLLYTASGTKEGNTTHDPNWLTNDAEQKVALATAEIQADASGVFFAGQNFRDSRIVAEADGTLYQTWAQSQGAPIVYAFRDPFLFRDPVDDQTYMLFEGNTAGRAGTYACQQREIGPVPPGHVVPRNANLYTGNIGVARARNSSLTSWTLLPPLISSNCVNQQLERPHFVIEHGTYYLFTISHTGTYAPGLTGPDGLYGFYGPSLRSEYRPLNASGLVLGNPEEAPFQQYSEYVMPNWLVEAFIDNQTGPGQPIREGGTLAPTLRLQVEGSNTYLVERLDYGYIPAMLNVGGGDSGGGGCTCPSTTTGH
jgi:levansucrase